MRLTTTNAGPDIRLIETTEPTKADDTAISAFVPLDEEAYVLHVDYVCPPWKRFDQWAEIRSDRVTEVKVIYAGYAADDSTQCEDIDPGVPFDTPPVSLVDSRNVSNMGLQIVKYLQRTTRDDRHVTIYVDSLSLMFQYTAANVVVEFLRECIRQCNAREIEATFLYTPTVHAEETREQIQSFFE